MALEMNIQNCLLDRSSPVNKDNLKENMREVEKAIQGKVFFSSMNLHTHCTIEEALNHLSELYNKYVTEMRTLQSQAQDSTRRIQAILIPLQKNEHPLCIKRENLKRRFPLCKSRAEALMKRMEKWITDAFSGSYFEMRFFYMTPFPIDFSKLPTCLDKRVSEIESKVKTLKSMNEEGITLKTRALNFVQRADELEKGALDLQNRLERLRSRILFDSSVSEIESVNGSVGSSLPSEIHQYDPDMDPLSDGDVEEDLEGAVNQELVHLLNISTAV